MPAAETCQWHVLVRSKREWGSEDRRSVEIPERIGHAGSMPAGPRHPVHFARSSEPTNFSGIMIEDGRGEPTTYHPLYLIDIINISSFLTRGIIEDAARLYTSGRSLAQISADLDIPKTT